MSGTIINNPLAWAHFKLRGGWKTGVWTLAIYAALTCGVILLTSRVDPTGRMLRSWPGMLLGLQAAVLLLYGGMTIGNAVRRDLTNGLLESHRMMPISPGAAVFGYLVGPSFPAICLAMVNLVIGTAIVSMTSQPVDRWMMANIIIGLFVAFFWVGVAFTSFLSKNAFGLLFGIMFPMMSAGGALVEIVPGLAVLVTPMSGGSVFAMYGMGRRVSIGYAWGFLAQITFGAIFYRGAMRRYRRDDIPALGVLLALMALSAWIGVSAIGIIRWADFRADWFMRRDQVEQPMRAITTMMGALLIAIGAVNAAARSTNDWNRARRLTGRPAGRRPLDPLIVALLATAIILPLLWVSPPPAMPRNTAIGRAAVMTLSFLVGIAYLLRIFFRAGRKALALLVIWMVATWFIPLAIDGILVGAFNRRGSSVFGLASPLGETLNLWSAEPVLALHGLGFQALLTLTLAVLFHRTEPSGIRN